MGYFAVLHSDDEQLCRVRRCHLNLWCLPTFVPSRRLLYLDVGVQIEATGSKPVRSIQMLLPFRVEAGHWPDGEQSAHDLYNLLALEDVAELVFGGPVTQTQADSGHRILQIGDYQEDLWLVRTKVDDIKPAEGYSNRSDSSLYEVPLEREIQPGESRYIRLRWRLLESNQLWQRQRKTGGAHVDFRICDVRESRFVQKERSLRTRLCEIQTVNFFLMAPAHLNLLTTSPVMRYVRVLEPGAWKRYLESAAYSRENRGVLVYYWRYAKTRTEGAQEVPVPISADNPFRVFVQFGQQHSHRWTLLKFVLAFLLGTAILKYAPFIPTLIGSIPVPSTAQLLTLLGLFGVPAVLAAIGRTRRALANGLLYPRKKLRALERTLLATTSRRRS